MLSPNAIDPRFAPMLRDLEHIPTLNEQATWRMLHQRHHAFVQKWVNPIVALLLNSRLHWLLSGSTMLITFCGRSSGRFITLPVNYVAGEDGVFYAISAPDRAWWRNLVGGAPVTLCVKGQSLDGFGTAIVEPRAVANELAKLIEYAPTYRKLLAIDLMPDGTLMFADLARAAQRRVVIRVQLH